MSLHLVTPPTEEPFSLLDLKNHLRISDNVDDSVLQRLRSVVRQRGERATRRAFLTQTWDQFLDTWPVGTLTDRTRVIDLQKAPLQSVTFVKYTDLADAQQTWATTDYDVDAPVGPYCRRGRLSLGWNKVWPILRPMPNAVQIRTVCGYGDKPEDVPEILVQAMLLDAGTLYDIRGSVLAGSRAAAIEIPGTSQDIYRSFRSL